MSLEQDIKQKKFNSQAEKAIININFTHSYFASQLNTALKVHNISVQQFNVLRILKGSDPKPVSINDITDRMIDKMSNASRLVEKLRLKGFVKRSKCSFDKRQVDVSITEKGKTALLELNRLTSGVIEDHKHVSEEEFKTLNSILDKIRSKAL